MHGSGVCGKACLRKVLKERRGNERRCFISWAFMDLEKAYDRIRDSVVQR